MCRSKCPARLFKSPQKVLIIQNCKNSFAACVSSKILVNHTNSHISVAERLSVLRNVLLNCCLDNLRSLLGCAIASIVVPYAIGKNSFYVYSHGGSDSSKQPLQTIFHTDLETDSSFSRGKTHARPAACDRSCY